MASAPLDPPPPPPPPLLPPVGVNGPPASVERPEDLPPTDLTPLTLPPSVPAISPAKPTPAPEVVSPTPSKPDALAALLSYLIPGLGQIYQGRAGKGLLFFVGLYALFFYGMSMGQWQNVWLADAADLPDVEVAGQRLGGTPKALAYRPQFLAQFWIGIAAWPAVVQYHYFDPMKDTGPVFGTFQRAPKEDTLNDLQRAGNKRWDLGWVYTVIAGVLNLLVIYDALAGPMFRDPPPGADEKNENTTT